MLTFNDSSTVPSTARNVVSSTLCKFKDPIKAGLPEEFVNSQESVFSDILANASASSNKSRVCREAKTDGKYIIDLIEECPNEDLFLYEVKKVESKSDLRSTVYLTLGQTMFYSSLLKKKHRCRILLVTAFQPEEAPRTKTFLNYIRKTFSVAINVVFYEDVLRLRGEPGYREVKSDRLMCEEFLNPLV